MTDSDEPKGKEKRQKGGLGKGFHAPLQLSDALAKFLGESATSDVIKRKWDYIKGNNLQIKLQDMIENNGQPSSEAFQSIVGKEKPGRMRCHGRTTTLTLLKRNEEIKKLKREHADEVAQVRTVV
ncbi:unnamed protein product [Trifolium pratense]|uniref:Uncharacterized protein n=1 Tax=Trifolium pratense TaxID=57577 RepID=A0ACB0KD07_TRIPR|nr:unnamed protein product [Trifolium pratense]